MSAPRKVEFPCPVCGSNSYSVAYEDTIGESLPIFSYDFRLNDNRTYRIVKCAECTHYYASPRHEGLYAHYDGKVVDEIYMGLQHQRLMTDRKVIKELLRLKSSGKLLDVGCATGDFLSVASAFFDVEGLELTSWSTEVARRRGFTVHQHLLRDIPPDARYDVITLWGVIEHFEYPADEIGRIAGMLRDGGIVAVWTGNIESLFPRVIGRRWWYFQGQHIQMFTKRSLARLFKHKGFEIVYIKRYPYVISGRSLANSLQRYPLISRIAQPFLRGTVGRHMRLTLRLPGEMLAVFRKLDAGR